MTIYSGATVGFLLVDGYDLLGYTTKVDINEDAKIEDVTTLGDSWQQMLPSGLREFNLSQEGFYDTVALGPNVALVSQYGTSRLLCIGLEGNTLAKRFIGFEGAMQNNYDRKTARGSLHTFSVNYAGNGEVDDGIILLPQSTLTGDTANGTSYDSTLVGGTATGGVGHVQITAYTAGGATDLIVKIQDSPDNAAWSDLVTFTAITGRDAQRVEVTGQVDRYLRYMYDFSGGGGGSSFNGFVGFSRK